MRLAFLLLVVLSSCSGGRPRVYNALISTNQELLPSRAFPAVSPIIGQPLYLAPSGLELPHKEEFAPQQQYPDATYEYQAQEIEQVYDDSYDDRQFQEYEKEPDPDPTRYADIHPGVHLSREPIRKQQREFPRAPQDTVRSSHERTDMQRRPIPQTRRPQHRQRDRPDAPEQRRWSDEEPETSSQGRQPVRHGQDAASRPEVSARPPQYFSGGLPLNNQPENIPVVPPPPIPIRLKN